MSRFDWNEERLRYLTEHFPTESADDIADVVGCSNTTVRGKARELGLQKAPDYSTKKYIGRYTGKYKNKRVYEKLSDKEGI